MSVTFEQAVTSLQDALTLFKEDLRLLASATSASVVEEREPAAAAVAAAAPVEIPEYAKPDFADLTPNQQRFVLAVIDKVRKNDGINMANITNTHPHFQGIPFPKEDFPGKRLVEIISTYTTFTREGDNIRLPEKKPVKGAKKATAKKATAKKATAKKATVGDLKSVAEFNNDFAEAISDILDGMDAPHNWGDDSSEVKIGDVLTKLGDLSQYEIDENDPCASLNGSRFLINDRTGMVSIIPADV